jgi:uncharacterized protein (DUF885 family)
MRALLLAALLAAPATAQEADAALKALYEEEWAWRRAEFVQVEDGLRTRPGERFAGVAPADQARRLAHWEAMRARIEAVPETGLSDEERINRAVLLERLRAESAAIRWRTYEAPLNSDTFFWAQIRPYAGLETADDFRRYVARLRDVPRFFAENIANMRAGMARGWTVPAVTLKGRDATIEPLTLTGADNPLLDPLRAMPATIPMAEQARLRAEAEAVVREHVAPAARGLLAFVREEYLPAARTSVSAADLPDGAAFYRDQIREFTTLDLEPDAIHAIGLAEVGRIENEMRATIRETGFAGDFPAFLEHLRSEPRFYATTPRQLLGEASYIAKKMDGKLGQVFATLPRFRFTIVPVPDAIAPIYTSGRGGLTACQFNTYDLKSRPLYNLTALVLHECAPGHSHQAAVALEAPARPAFRRESYFSGYGEGWGLYVEWLGRSLGMYETPYDEFGRQTFEMWRAARLVIDTGLHSRGWSRQQAIDYLASRTALARLDIENEVDRYISWPGQALAYKLGELTIRRLRGEAEAALGPFFDQRPFHDAILALGSVPLPVLEREMRRWIEAETLRAGR